MGEDWYVRWWGKKSGEGGRGLEGCWDVSIERTQWLGDLATSDLRPPQMPGCRPEPQAKWPSHPSGIHRNKSRRDCHLFLRKRLNRKCPGQLSPVSQDSRQPSLQKSARFLRGGRLNPLPSLHCAALCTWPAQPWLLKALPVRSSGADGGSLSQPKLFPVGQAAEAWWSCLLTRLSWERGGRAIPLPPASTVPVPGGDAKMEFSEFCQQEPHKEEDLGDRAGATTPQLGRHSDLSISLVLRIILLDRYYYFIPFRNEV